MADAYSVVSQRLKIAPDEPAASQVKVALESALESAQAAWPKVRVEPDAFATAVMNELKLTTPSTFATDLSQLVVSDLFLSTAALAGDAAALKTLADTLLPNVCRSLRRVAGFGGLAEDAAQILYERLLVPADGKRPQLVGYSARGPLVHWLRTTALRELLLQRRRVDRRTKVETEVIAESAPIDVELEMIRRLHGEDFRRAFEASFLTLTSRQRCVLRMHVLDGLNIDQIAQFYATHRTTAFRWLEAAREDLAIGIRKKLAAELTLNRSELESFLGLVGSELTFSLNRLLRSSTSASK